MRSPTHNRWLKQRQVLIAAAVFVPAHFAAAQVSWNGGSSNWANSNNWTSNVVPTSGDVEADNFGVVPQTINYDFTGTNALQVLALAGTTANSILSMSANSLNASSQTIDGYGIFNQSGGSNIANQQLEISGSSASAGLYTLSNGTLIAEQESIGLHGPGNFNQSGGTNTASAELLIADNSNISGTYTLTGNGALVASDQESLGNGGNALFNQSGGTNTLQTGASLYIGNTSGAIYFLSGSGSLSVTGDEYVGLLGSGNFNQSGGTHAVTGNLHVGAYGHPAGYLLTAGQLTIGGQLSVSSAGSFNQTGGSVALLPQPLASDSADVINSLSISTDASFDVSNNALDLPLASLSTFNSLIQQGYNHGKWNASTGIVSSSAAADTTHLTAIGVIQNNQGGSALFTDSIPFEGVTPDVGDILLKFTYYGDTNLDGKVDGSDYSRIDAAYLADKSNPTGLTGWFNGDFNYDGLINGSDYTLIDNAFNAQSTQLTASLAASTAIATNQVAGSSPVPEPTACLLSAITAITFLARRRGAIAR